LDLKPLRNEDDYDAAVAEIARLWDAEPGTPEHDKLEVLGILVDHYEESRWPIRAPDPVAAISLRMEAKGYSRADLAKVLGRPSRVSEILRGRRRLTMEMARKLHTEWGIPAEVLLQPMAAEEPRQTRRQRIS
jgi:HTH-type transcriptional regulator/antitoxin HigA